MINLSQQLRLGLKLTPQQVQYLKLLQLPTLSLEQRIKLELELNPMLELNEEQELSLDQEDRVDEPDEKSEEPAEEIQPKDDYTIEDYLNDDLSGFKSPEAYKNNDEDDTYESPQQSTIPLSERLLSQLKMFLSEDEEILLGEEILGNVDEDGYLRRDVALIVQDLNLSFGLTISVEKAEGVLQKILFLDPPGIAARTLQ
jgi:RNA polymerase sigma-54 factor